MFLIFSLFFHVHSVSVSPPKFFVDACFTFFEVDPVLSLTLIKCMTYGHLVSDLENLISTKGAKSGDLMLPFCAALSWETEWKRWFFPHEPVDLEVYTLFSDKLRLPSEEDKLRRWVSGTQRDDVWLPLGWIWLTIDWFFMQITSKQGSPIPLRVGTSNGAVFHCFCHAAGWLNSCNFGAELLIASKNGTVATKNCVNSKVLGHSGC